MDRQDVPEGRRAEHDAGLFEGLAYCGLADGLAGNIEPGSITLDLVRQLVDDIILVTESEIARAVKEAFEEMHLALEGSAVTGIAALLTGGIPGLSGKRVAVIVTGRNIDRNQLLQLLR